MQLLPPAIPTLQFLKTCVMVGPSPPPPLPHPALSGHSTVASRASPPPSASQIRRDPSASPSLLPRDAPRPSMSSSSSLSAHRPSFSDTLRGHPPSPRARRQPSLTQAAIQDLVDNPPVAHPGGPAFAGREWKSIAIGELVEEKDLHFVELDTGVEAATNVRCFFRCVGAAG